MPGGNLHSPIRLHGAVLN